MYLKGVFITQSVCEQTPQMCYRDIKKARISMYFGFLWELFLASQIHRRVIQITQDCPFLLTFCPLNCLILIPPYLKLCLATANHNFRWGEITHIRLVWDEKI